MPEEELRDGAVLQPEVVVVTSPDDGGGAALSVPGPLGAGGAPLLVPDVPDVPDDEPDDVPDEPLLVPDVPDEPDVPGGHTSSSSRGHAHLRERPTRGGLD